MKKILILLLGLVSLNIHAQNVEQMKKYMRFVPSNMASDIILQISLVKMF